MKNVILVAALAGACVAMLAGCASTPTGGSAVTPAAVSHAIRAEYEAYDVAQVGLTLATSQGKLSIANANSAQADLNIALTAIDAAEASYLAGNTSAAQVALSEAVAAINQSNSIVTPTSTTKP